MSSIYCRENQVTSPTEDNYKIMDEVRRVGLRNRWRIVWPGESFSGAALFSLSRSVLRVKALYIALGIDLLGLDSGLRTVG